MVILSLKNSCTPIYTVTVLVVYAYLTLGSVKAHVSMELYAHQTEQLYQVGYLEYSYLIPSQQMDVNISIGFVLQVYTVINNSLLLLFSLRPMLTAQQEQPQGAMGISINWLSYNAVCGGQGVWAKVNMSSVHVTMMMRSGFICISVFILYLYLYFITCRF